MVSLPTFKKYVMGLFMCVHPYLKRKYIESLADKWSMLQLATTDQRFTNCPAALYATDVTY